MAPLTLETFRDLPTRCRECVRWELPQDPATAESHGHRGLEKEAWLSHLLLSWPTAGRVAYVGEQSAGYALVAPPSMTPRSAHFPTSPVSPDAALLITGHVYGWARGMGVGRMLVQGVAKDLTLRGFHALEVFANRAGADAAGEETASSTTKAVAGPAIADAQTPVGGEPCLLPAGFAETVGFTVVADDPVVPRLRLELRTALDWREDVEAALDRLLTSLTLTSL